MSPSRPIWQRLAPYALLVMAWGALTMGNRWYVNPDAGIYSLIATRLAAGEFGEAVLPYWSPLFPALAAPLVALGIEPFLALRLVLLAAALLVIPSLRSLSQKAGASHAAADVAISAAVVMLTANAVNAMNPDLVFVAIALRCVDLLLTLTSVRAAALAGALGGCAYLAKAVALPYLLAVVVALLGLRWIHDRGTGRLFLRLGAVALLALAVTSAGWVAVISARAGYPTISTADAFNTALVQPGVLGSPMRQPGVYPLPSSAALTTWESPSELPIPRGSEAGAPEPGVAATASNRVENSLRQAAKAVGVFARWWAPVSLLALVGLVAAWRRGGQARVVVVGSITAGVGFAAGMVLLIVVQRYLWLPMLCMVPAAALGLDVLAWRIRLMGGRWFSRLGAVALLVVVAVSYQSLALEHWQTDREVWQLAERLNADAPLAGPLAGSSGWRQSQLLGILTGAGYVGLAPKKLDEAELIAQLQAVGAKHLVTWPTKSSKPAGRNSPVIVEDVSDTGLVRHDGG